MEYKFYDPPLDFFGLSEESETRATRQEILALAEQAYYSGEQCLAEIDYELHFGCCHDLVINRFVIEGFNDGPRSLKYGGPVAVYRECIRRNMTVNQLWGRNKPEETLEQRYKMPYEDCIAQLKKWREGALECVREYQQAQQQQK